MNRNLFRYVVFLGLVSVLALVPFLVQSGYILRILFMILLYVALAESWNVLGGYAGQICLGIGAFFGVGAYAAALSFMAGIPYLISLLLGGFAALVLALALTPILKLRGVYFAMGSLFLPEILKSLMLNLRDITGGATGVILPVDTSYHRAFCYLVALVLALTVVLTAYIMSKSRFRFAFEAIREDESAAAALGVNPLRFKVIALLFTSFCSGIAGAILAYSMVYIEPYGVFELSWSVVPVFISIIGGVGTLLGPIIGTMIYMIFSQAIAISFGEINLLILGSLLIVVIMFMPGGIYNILRKAYNYVLGRG